ncbi:SlyX family protein [Wenxinia saemankumensis]|uniref:SlyX protein n=1 Tax=Wenxinia saemankumensis TaxID=1447782 RepID=A0A1M6FHL0_9RHOB|nr:SlyX family protein [Wenxinia saemankumensis]SHI97119.1 SlyX protein [Wenxinia saemankumensis]
MDPTALEERLAHLERLCDDLSDVAARQAREIEALQRRVTMLMQREAEREEGQDTPITRPPHY